MACILYCVFKLEESYVRGKCRSGNIWGGILIFYILILTVYGSFFPGLCFKRGYLFSANFNSSKCFLIDIRLFSNDELAFTLQKHCKRHFLKKLHMELLNWWCSNSGNVNYSLNNNRDSLPQKWDVVLNIKQNIFPILSDIHLMENNANTIYWRFYLINFSDFCKYILNFCKQHVSNKNHLDR